MAGHIYREKKSTDFVILGTRCLRDAKLKWDAKGLHSYVMQLPDDWRLNIADLQQRSANGRDGTNSPMNALIEAGYVVRQRAFDGSGKFSGYDYHVFEHPEQAAAFLELNGKTVNGKTVNGKTVNGKTVNGKTVNGKTVNGKTVTNKVLSQESIKEESIKEGREIALPLPPAGETFTFGAEKLNEPLQGGGAAGGPGAKSHTETAPAWPAVSDPYAWPTEASGPCPEQRGGNPADWAWVDDPAPAHVTTYAVPTSETFEAAPGGPPYRAEVRAPAEREVVKPKAKVQKAQPQPRAVEIPETHAAVAPELARLLCKKHYLQKSAERLAAEMGWLFSKPVAFALRHIQDSLSSGRKDGAWAALDFNGCEDAFARWQKDERARAQAQQGQQGPGASQQAMQRAQSPIHQSPVFGERRL